VRAAQVAQPFREPQQLEPQPVPLVVDWVRQELHPFMPPAPQEHVQQELWQPVLTG
jgi:hypothetical protein